MRTVIFFKKKKPLYINNFFPNFDAKKKIEFDQIKTLNKSNKQDLTFFDSMKYKDQAQNTKASFCITTQKLEKYLPKETRRIIVKNVLFELAKILKKIYPDADIDYPDLTLKKPSKSKFKSVKFGNNVLVGKNVRIGKNCIIGANTVIEHDVVVGNNCIISSHVVLKNSILGNNVVIQSGCKIGMKGFGFIPINENNFKFPHIGRVLIDDNVEIAAGCTIDRGSVDDTEIGKNTYLDNQVHMAHNVKIGSNCMIAGQVGFAGSSKIGNSVSIGGQAGISGHLRIGNNVKIGGGSGVVKDVEDNQIVMGYPAVKFRDFLKKNR